MRALTWLDRYSPSVALLIVIGTFAAAALISAVGRLPSSNIATPTPALIYVLSTPVPTTAPTPDTAMLQEIEQLKARVNELEAERANLSEPATSQQAEPVIYQQLTVQEQPAPTAYTANPQLVNSEAGTTMEINVPTDAPRYCEGFHDWRDYDAMYASSPACHKATP